MGVSHRDDEWPVGKVESFAIDHDLAGTGDRTQETIECEIRVESGDKFDLATLAREDGAHDKIIRLHAVEIDGQSHGLLRKDIVDLLSGNKTIARCVNAAGEVGVDLLEDDRGDLDLALLGILLLLHGRFPFCARVRGEKIEKVNGVKCFRSSELLKENVW